MPFTLAHPAIILPLSRRYFHFPALVLGSMSPDFIYYLSGKPTDGGHTIFHSEWLNLPLCLLFYGIYLAVIKKSLWENLPQNFSYKLPKSPTRPFWQWLPVFFFSAWIGMLSHIFLDDFTHGSAIFVQAFPLLQKKIYVPIYTWLQYGGTTIGFIAIGIYLRIMSKHYPYPQTRTTKQKQTFWFIIFGLSSLAFLCWNMALPIPLKQHGILIVRAVDCTCIVLFLMGLFKNKRNT